MTGKEKFINESKLNFIFIGTEESRTYVFPGGDLVQIDNPLYINVSSSGSHRIFDGQGVSHYVPSGWNHLSWITKPGDAHFVF